MSTAPTNSKVDGRQDVSRKQIKERQPRFLLMWDEIRKITH